MYSDPQKAATLTAGAQVSVPFRGLDVFGRGDYGPTVLHALCFRPLSGIRCIRTPGERQPRRQRQLVSVPFRGLDVFGHNR